MTIKSTTVSISLLQAALQDKWTEQLRVYAVLRAMSVDTAGWLTVSEAMGAMGVVKMNRSFFDQQVRWLLKKGLVVDYGHKIHIISQAKVMKLLNVQGWNTVEVNLSAIPSKTLFKVFCVEAVKAEFIKKKWIASRRPSNKIDQRDKSVIPAKLQQKASDYLAGKGSRNVGACSVRLSSGISGLSKTTISRFIKIAKFQGWAQYALAFDVAIDKLKIRCPRASGEVSLALNLNRPLVFDKKTGLFRLRIADIITTNIRILYSNSLRSASIRLNT